MAVSDEIKNTYGSWIRNTGGNTGGAAGIASSIGNAVNTAKNVVSNRSTSGSTGTGAATYTSAWAGTDPVDSYEEFLRNREPIYGTIRDQTVAYWDEQSQKALAGIEEQRQAAHKYAADQRNAIYATAESQRVAAEQRADTERERGVVDARSSYEQNKASYGANAEAMGNMGLSGSGYSDYLNSKAYAQQRAETQAANAQADASKREARYIEDQTRLQADASYSENLFNADSQARSDKLAAEQAADKGMFDANMSYQENLFKNDDAIGKYRSEQEEKEEQRADSTKGAYYQFLAEANQGKYTVEQVTQLAADYGLSEEQTQSLIGAVNDYDTNSQAAADETAADSAKGAYYQFLAEANQGNYSVEQITQLAADYGLSEEQTQSLVDAVNGYTKKQQSANADEIMFEIDSYGSDYDVGKIDKAEQSGEISAESAQEARNKYNSRVLSDATDNISGGDETIIANTLKDADSLRAEGKITEDTYQAIYLKAAVQDANSITDASSYSKFKQTLASYKNNGKISDADYNSALKYAASKVGSVASPSSYTFEYKEIYPGAIEFYITIDGNRYGVYFDSVNSDTQSMLNEVASGGFDSTPAFNTVIECGGRLYCYSKYGWGRIHTEVFSRQFKALNYSDLYNAYCAASGKGTKTVSEPKHASSSSSSGGNSPDTSRQKATTMEKRAHGLK